MKRTIAFALPVFLILLVIISGCTSSTPAQTPATPAAPAATAAPAPAVTQNPYPAAAAVNTPIAFGSGVKIGDMTVMGYKVMPTFNYTDPSVNSQREQMQSAAPLQTLVGYVTKKPAEGNTFVFIYLKFEGTGTESAWAPAPKEIMLSSGGKLYQQTPLASAKTIVVGEEESTKYDYWYNTGDTKGAVLPAKANTIKGYLVYEVPATFSPANAYVVTNLYSDKQGVWKLV